MSVVLEFQIQMGGDCMRYDAELYNLLGQYWGDYLKHRKLSAVVTSSIPVVWFGNFDKYKVSKKKIVTVAINPSYNEFPVDTPVIRFPAAGKLFKVNCGLNTEEMNTLIASYNDYFIKNPYKRFFEYGFEVVLQNLPYNAKASYGYHPSENTAIHIDCQTALATQQKWSALKPEIQADIRNEDLFKSLLRYLDPDIILLTSNKKVLNTFVTEKDKFISEKVNRSYRIGCKFEGRLLIFGSFSYGTPFGGVANGSERHRTIMKKIFDKYQSWKDNHA